MHLPPSPVIVTRAEWPHFLRSTPSTRLFAYSTKGNRLALQLPGQNVIKRNLMDSRAGLTRRPDRQSVGEYRQTDRHSYLDRLARFSRSARVYLRVPSIVANPISFIIYMFLNVPRLEMAAVFAHLVARDKARMEGLLLS